MPVYKDEERKTWFASFYYKDWTGKNRKKKKEGFKTRRDALAFEREFKLQHERSCEMKFSSFVELYRADAEHQVRESTKGTQDAIIDKWIIPYLGDLQTDKIDAVTIRNWQNTLKSKTNPKTGRKYAETYLRTIHSRLSAIFNFAVQFYNLRSNPCKAAGSMGKKSAGKMKFWTLAEFKLAMTYVTKPAFRLALLILYWTGLRIGEALALTPVDVLPDHSLRVEKTHHRKDGEDVEGPPKTENSIRDTRMPKFLYEAVLEYIAALYEIDPSDRIFYFSHGTINRELDRIAALASIKRIRVHDLRHSHAALMIELGYSIVAVAERLGDSVKVAMETYSHLYPGKMDSLADDLERHASGETIAERPTQKTDLADLLETLETVEKASAEEK